MKNLKKHVIVASVDNNPGVVSRISGLFTRRGYNIESLVTGVTENPKVYKLVITLIASEEEANLLIRQLGRVMEVIEVYLAAERECVTSELMFLKIKCDLAARTEIIKTADALRLEIAAVGKNSVIIQVTGDNTKLESALFSFGVYSGDIEFIRSGSVTIEI